MYKCQCVQSNGYPQEPLNMIDFFTHSPPPMVKVRESLFLIRGHATRSRLERRQKRRKAMIRMRTTEKPMLT